MTATDKARLVSRRAMLKTTAASAAALTLGGTAMRAFAQGPEQLPEAVAELIPAAQQEPEAILFGLSIAPDRVGAFREALNGFYGFNLNVQFQGGLSPQKAAEIVQLVTRGVPAGVDLFYTSDTSAVFLRESDVIIADDWARDLGIPEERLVDGSAVKIIDSSLPLMSYNTELVDEADLPTSWEDLLDERWRGRITTARAPTGPFFFNTYAIGEERMTAVLEGLMQHDIIWVPRLPEAVTRLLSGEALIALGADIESQAVRGAPLAYVPIEPMLLTQWGTYLIKGTRAPNLSKLFAYFISTDTGQDALDEATGYSTMDRPTSTKARLLEGYDVEHVPVDWVNENHSVLIPKYSRIMGLR